MTSDKKPEPDPFLAEVKREIQKQSREAVIKGELKQTDLFLIRAEIARRAVITLKK
jgi:hypothetical protein